MSRRCCPGRRKSDLVAFTPISERRDIQYRGTLWTLYRRDDLEDLFRSSETLPLYLLLTLLTITGLSPLMESITLYTLCPRYPLLHSIHLLPLLRGGGYPIITVAAV